MRLISPRGSHTRLTRLASLDSLGQAVSTSSTGMPEPGDTADSSQCMVHKRTLTECSPGFSMTAPSPRSLVVHRPVAQRPKKKARAMNNSSPEVLTESDPKENNPGEWESPRPLPPLGGPASCSPWPNTSISATEELDPEAIDRGASSPGISKLYGPQHNEDKGGTPGSWQEGSPMHASTISSTGPDVRLTSDLEMGEAPSIPVACRENSVALHGAPAR